LNNNAENNNGYVRLVLNESGHARDFGAAGRVHHAEFAQVIDMVERLTTPDSLSAEKMYLHNTITVFGTRGSGKTSFLLSLKEQLKESKTIQVLKLVDPTLIEQKGHVFLNVISHVSKLVNAKLEKDETENKFHAYDRRGWNDAMMHLAAGLPSIDGIGSKEPEDWQDPEFVMYKGLSSVGASIDLAENFAIFLKLSLDILQKEAFVLIFDDIDVDSTKGWMVLETIRKYFTSSRLITILSGDLKLYSSVVRQKKWSNFGDDLLKYEAGMLGRAGYFNEMVTELEAQYLQKIMQPKFRIHLLSLLEKRKRGDSLPIYISEKMDEVVEGLEIGKLYGKIFKSFGMKNVGQLEVYLTFIMSQPLRSQLQFISVFRPCWSKTNLLNAYPVVVRNENISDIFLADLLSKDVDVNLLTSTEKYLNVIILHLLLKEGRLRDLYQLQPTTTDNSLNACLLSFNLLLAKSFRSLNLFLAIDYQIKIGFVRNLLGLLPSAGGLHKASSNVASIEDMCLKTGLLNDGVLRDVTGNINAYIYGYLESIGRLDDLTMLSVSLLGLNGPAKREAKDRLDYVFPNDGSVSSILGYIPSYSGSYSFKNESRIGYSIYMLIAAIGELLKVYETSSSIDDEQSRKLKLQSTLIELSQHRSYAIPRFGNVDSTTEVLEEELEDYQEVDIQSYPANKESFLLADLLGDWMKSSVGQISVAPHLLGKISTRLFYALGNIAERRPKEMSLGDLFHFQVVAFMNAVVIEDIRENFHNSSFLNINNTNFSDRILIANITNASDELALKDKNYLRFSRWMISSPLLLAYIRTEANTELTEALRAYCEPYINDSSLNLSITDQLDQIGVRGNYSNLKGRKKREDNQNAQLAKKGNEKALWNVIRKRNLIPLFEQVDEIGVMRTKNTMLKAELPGLFEHDGAYSSKIRDLRKRLYDLNLMK